MSNLSIHTKQPQGFRRIIFQNKRHFNTSTPFICIIAHIHCKNMNYSWLVGGKHETRCHTGLTCKTAAILHTPTCQERHNSNTAKYKHLKSFYSLTQGKDMGLCVIESKAFMRNSHNPKFYFCCNENRTCLILTKECVTLC